LKRKKTAKRRVARKVRGKKLERIPPTSEAARDEGPRLIPLDEPGKEPSRVEHYLDLADAALGVKRQGESK
jgi:hypothetical protein